MSYESNWKAIEGWPFNDFAEIGEYGELTRQITGYGAETLKMDYAHLERALAIKVSQNWHLWEPGQQWKGGGDRGGILGFGQADPLGVARRALRPLFVCQRNLEAAQSAIVKLPVAWNQWMEPWNRAPRRGTPGRHAGFQNTPGQRREQW